MAVTSGFFKLRADQYRDDPVKWFVKPPIDIASLDYGDHSIRLIGSRGCGKTMLLRSIAEQEIGASLTGTCTDANSRIRVYIRPDNQLINSLRGWDVPLKLWESIALELMLLRILREICSKVSKWALKHGYTETLYLDESKFSFSDNGTNIDEWLRIKLHMLYKWVRTPDVNSPLELNIAALDNLATLVSTLTKRYANFPTNYSISIYIDELEIYPEYQQKLINDWIKNPSLGWVFHVAHRRYFAPTHHTSSLETIEASNDYRLIDLDEPLMDASVEGKKKREDFYREIIQKEITIYGDDINIEANNLLPKITLEDTCILMRETHRASEAWGRLVKKACQVSRTEKDLNKILLQGQAIEDARWWAMWPALIASNKTELIDSTDSKRAKDWLGNKLLGSLLQIYIESNEKLAPLVYSGFSRICSIVLSNIREFMLIIRQAIENELVAKDTNLEINIIKTGISYESQAKAILTRSENFSLFVSISANKFGFNIQQALDNWYFFLRNVQSIPSLPYNEPNHIVCDTSIKQDTNGWQIIEAGQNHGAFIVESATKIKKHDRVEGYKTIKLHPLLCAWKYLSYRNRNSPTLNWADIESITMAPSTEIVRASFNSKFENKVIGLSSNHEFDF